MSSRARRDATITTSVASIVAFVALLIPQVAGALNLTILGKVLVVVGVGFVTAFGQRLLICWRTRQDIVAAVRVWPPERLRGARLDTLGVYPTQSIGGHLREYQERPHGEDEQVRNALANTTRHVLVHGPARCGKSRAVSHWAEQELSEVPAVIFLDSESLRKLVDRGLDFPFPEATLCLWLDGLDRFTGALDPSALETIRGAKKPTVRIIATVRSDQWAELLAGTDADSQAARALSEQAEVVPLGEFTPQPSPKVVPPPARAVKPHLLLGDAPLLLLSLMVLVLVGVGGFFGVRGAIFTPPSIPDQITSKTSQLLAESPRGGHVVLSERVQLHSTDAPSWMIVIQDLPTAADFQAGAAENGKLMPQSDDLRIYDVVSGRLRLKLHFRPRGFGPTAAEWVSLRAGATQDDADYAENGSDEVIAGFAQPDVATSALLPFAIEWQYGRYVLISLTRDKPDLGTQGLDRAAITFRRQAYETRVTFHNAVVDPPVSGLTLEGYRVQAFALTRTPSLRLLTGYFGAYPVYGQAHVLEIHANQFRSGISIAPCQPTYWACPAPIAPQDAVVPAAKAFDKGLLQGWDIDSTKWITPVQICPVRSPATTARLCPATQNATKPTQATEAPAK